MNKFHSEKMILRHKGPKTIRFTKFNPLNTITLCNLETCSLIGIIHKSFFSEWIQLSKF